MCFVFLILFDICSEFFCKVLSTQTDCSFRDLLNLVSITQAALGCKSWTPVQTAGDTLPCTISEDVCVGSALLQMTQWLKTSGSVFFSASCSRWALSDMVTRALPTTASLNKVSRRTFAAHSVKERNLCSSRPFFSLHLGGRGKGCRVLQLFERLLKEPIWVVQVDSERLCGFCHLECGYTLCPHPCLSVSFSF